MRSFSKNIKQGFSGLTRCRYFIEILSFLLTRSKKPTSIISTRAVRRCSVSVGLTQWLVVGYMLAIGLIMPFGGYLMRRYPTRKLCLFALGIFLVGSLISALSVSFELVLLGRSIQGIGTKIILPYTFSIVKQVMPAQTLGQAMGVTAFIIMFAAAIGQV